MTQHLLSDVANQFGVSYETLRRWANRGTLRTRKSKVTRLGKTVRVLAPREILRVPRLIDEHWNSLAPGLQRSVEERRAASSKE